MNFLRTDRRTRINQLKLRMAVFMAVLSLFIRNQSLCSSLNTEGLALLRFRDRVTRDPFGALSDWNENDGVADPCAWFGVECSDGKVVTLTLKNLCLDGTLAPELGKLAYIKSIILRNNSFSGNIPNYIGELKDLEILDLGFNNFSGPFPSEFTNNLSLTTLLLDNNEFLGAISPELYELKTLSEFQADDNQLTGTPLRESCNCGSFIWNTAKFGDEANRKLLQAVDFSNPSRGNNVNKRSSFSPSPSPRSPSSLDYLPPSASPFSSISAPSDSPLSSPLFSPSQAPSNIFLTPSTPPILAPSPASTIPPNPPIIASPPADSHRESDPTPSPAPTPSQVVNKDSETNLHAVLTWVGISGGCSFILISVISIFYCRRNKVVTVKPWVTGLSGQLQKAFVTGVPKLNRPELEAACEDFSNIIGSFSYGTVYKGTLSSGLEIAVSSSAVTSPGDWSKTLNVQFRKKIETLSKVNHKNFVNLIGYCEEEKPFTRMMVFEYAPNGTLFEHLHIKEAEHLDWGMRLRIAMGMAYCLEYMHQLTPPVTHKNLQSSSIYLTEDYAAKISDFGFWKDISAAKNDSDAMKLLETPLVEPESNVYSFGVILFEMMTGRIPYSVDNGCLADWASDCLKGEQPLREMVDPTLKSFQVVELEEVFGVIKDCVQPDSKQRPSIRDITSKLREITAVGPDGATPKLSPLWWAELEIMSTDSS
ncbi:hypothetical protein I3843_13G061900 [Carya illinoinensis]|uniref:Protein kinase domain-containing protein n=2 Tax=Carya illinoinensis TaxID=32201 RepID=A0A922AMJ7_CARIL|nr:hypothetical protein I3760_13G070600 [Carya illinoinensis]KAG2673040.1 hypothetical protein I3760_13G070600 [Carya illinoinensis]KAG2673042.1 hypothetical protein I3760_13G070600 [Carya illinoinensis]KAG6681009.1 hypothetical protein I3842_13G071600 [Carya illinoinensis]KAG6681012.1 hypothetical protein I3842_13G071600 [Carya illinoinensis]